MLRRHLVFFAISVLFLVFAWLAFAPSTQATPPAAPITQLTFDKAVNVRPAWSRDNLFIAYQSNRNSETYHIYVMNADGSNTRALTKGTTDDRHPTWTFDGKSILFDSFDGKTRDIWMVNVADGRLTQLTRLGGLASFPSPSPDGAEFTFYYYKDDMMNLWKARIDVSDAKPLTRGLASAQDNQCTFACHVAAWTPDSQVIAYSGGDHESIWAMRRDGTDPTKVIGGDEHNHFPWFFGDGQMGYITEHVSSTDAYTEAKVYDFKTGKTNVLYERMGIQGPFEWSNDGKRVLFHSPRSGNFQIYMINLSDAEGIPTLRGTPAPAQPATNAPVTSTAASAPANIIPTVTVLLGIGSVGVAVAGLALGVYLLRRMRR